MRPIARCSFFFLQNKTKCGEMLTSIVPGPTPSTQIASTYAATLDLRTRRGRGHHDYEHIKHIRVPIRGHVNHIPLDRLRRAVECIERFIREKKDGEQMLVHCQHGVNRTGAVIISWLRRNGMSFEESLRVFAATRGKRPRARLLDWLRSVTRTSPTIPHG